MKLAIIEIPSGCGLAIAFDQLAMLQHATVVENDWINGKGRIYRVAPPDSRIEILVRDDAEVEPYVNPNEVTDPAPETPSPSTIARLERYEAMLHRVRNGETVTADEIDAVTDDDLPF